MGKSVDKDAEFEEIYEKLSSSVEFWSNSDRERDSEEDKHYIKSFGEAEALASWYNNTQSLMKLLYELEKEGKLSENQKRTYHRKRKEFGWDKVKSEKDIVDKNLGSDSPYSRLVSLLEHDCMAYRRGQKLDKALEEHWREWHKAQARELYEESGVSSVKLLDFAISDLAFTMDRLRNVEADGGLRTYIDENSGVSALYQESREVEEQANNDIKDIRVLTERYNELLSKLESFGTTPAMQKIKVTLENEIIYKAIALGYTAGINANTTETLRRMRGNNSSDNSFQG